MVNIISKNNFNISTIGALSRKHKGEKQENEELYF